MKSLCRVWVLCLAENKKVIMVGIPGVGKTTLLSKIVEVIKNHDKSVSVMSFGTLMFDVAKKNGLKDRDELRKLPVTEQQHLLCVQQFFPQQFSEETVVLIQVIF